MRKLLLFVCLFWGLSTYASHIVGGYITYKYLRDSTYEINLTVYRDCNSVTFFDGDPRNAGVPGAVTYATLGIFDDLGTLDSIIHLTNPVITEWPLPQDSNCPAQSGICLEKGVYTFTQTMPSSYDTYRLVYERCCRNATLVNVFNPSNTGFAIQATIPPSATIHNSSPQINLGNDIIVKLNEGNTIDLGISDSIDGDSVTFYFCDALSGGDVNNPVPNIPNGPPYLNVTWQSPYSTQHMLGQDTLIIDNTGKIYVHPTVVGDFLIGVCFNEYRDGALLTTTHLDFQLYTAACNNQNTGILTGEQPISQTTILPSPFNDYLQINCTSSIIRQVSIFNLSGDLVAEQTTYSPSVNFDNLATLPQGYYLIKVATADGQEFRKPVIKF